MFKVKKILKVSPLWCGCWNNGWVSPKYFSVGMKVYLPVSIDRDGEVKNVGLECNVYNAHGVTAQIENEAYGVDEFVHLDDVAIKESL